MSFPLAQEPSFAKSLKAMEAFGEVFMISLLVEHERDSSGRGIAAMVSRAAANNVLDDLGPIMGNVPNAPKVIRNSSSLHTFKQLHVFLAAAAPSDP